MSASLHILECGPATSLQDGGRRGYQRYGLSASGPMDRLAFAAANALVGNAPDAAVLELGLSGACVQAEGGAIRLALAGAPLALHVDGEPVADHRTLILREGSTLRIARPREGVFAYLAVAGGFALEPALGSLSLHLRAALGGLDGRGLRSGDLVPVHRTATAEPEHMLDPVTVERDAPIRVVPGPQDDHFTKPGLDTLFGATFTVSNRADRMGYQLDGPAIEHGERGFNIVSDATVEGSIQVPGNGRPIVLLADRQTTGGYPKIATVISADLRRIAQRRPGDTVRFTAVDLSTAVRAARERAELIAALPAQLRPVAEVSERLLAANLAGEVVDALHVED